MEFINGGTQLFYILKNSVWTPVGCLISDSFKESMEMLGTTTRDNPNGWTTSIPTKQSYSIDLTGLINTEYVSDDIITYYELVVNKRYKQLISWKADDGLGSFDYGQGYITSIGKASNIDEFVTFDCSIVGFGEVLNDELARLLQETESFVLLETNGKIIL